MSEKSLNSVFLVLLNEGNPLGPDRVHGLISPLVFSPILYVTSPKSRFILSVASCYRSERKTMQSFLQRKIFG